MAMDLASPIIMQAPIITLQPATKLAHILFKFFLPNIWATMPVMRKQTAVSS